MPSIYEQDWDDERQLYVSGRKVGLPLGPNAPHHPNKSEGKALRRLMAKSGDTEEEVRSSKRHRQELAKARKALTLPNPDRRAYELKIARRQKAARLGIEVWQLPT